ncbi:sulfatase-like hydrolase/transferase [Cupriavidus taiwanensis]|uniref:sulfatase-like hydrolase/transferase n=1 Tax=Cupriavidus taiwanensis TaxID=164546 RepID=UPI000E10CD87|nr:sulfatase-like hydrolase/transferase [Cupriavidus taiwanensis]SOY65018.1 Choline-sulfatase [Cupriavidus taiwanensis]SOY65299.1 Choline-sulfatase [Cupriavidus taiwanensis]SOY94133.1 Choline-sulfatase [Cupriavidus taiwanensis]SOZ69575.1 Choline-sulfatase [Cupriavidus taiwanensis]SOZ85775.1 Choline-sulfatase [Cupriavidus taiwanensis]
MTIRNTLFIMCDQLRRDHLGCYGHPTLRTRNIDALAARGVRFDRAYVTSGVCGPSRMSFYTGRYVSSHGATWNRVPLSVGEVTLGEYLKDSGRALALAGKTHVMPDNANLKRLHLDGGTELETLLRSGHFTEVDRHDGHHAEPGGAYADWLRRQGYDSADPWTDYVISAENARGEIVSGWHMRNAGLPARVAEPHSETAYTVGQAMQYIAARGDEPWVLHLSLVKPHWPYLAPAPYHAAYALDDCLPLQRHDAELEDPHPVLSAYRTQEECANFMRAEVSDTVRPAYQGLIQQIDDRLGLLWEQLERLGRWDDTLIVFTADHGDFLGDHWLGEKEQFYDTVQNIPLIVYDPSPQADATRGTAQDSLVSAVDVVPTVLDALGLPPADHRVEGRSLLDLTRAADRDGAGAWRDAVVSELDYAYRGARVALGRHPDACRAWMVRDARWKYVHWQGFRPQLFDLHNDPQEYFDLGTDPGHEAVRSAMRLRLLDWFCTLKPRVTVTNEEVAARTNVYKQAGVFFGVW